MYRNKQVLRIVFLQANYLALLEQADRLAQQAHPDMRRVIEGQKASIIARWDALKNQADDKQTTLKVRTSCNS